MIHKALSGIGEVPSYFSMSSIKFQGHRGHTIAEFDPNSAFPDCDSSLTDGYEMLRKSRSSIEEVPMFFVQQCILSSVEKNVSPTTAGR